jgi:hypothetical protein
MNIEEIEVKDRVRFKPEFIEFAKLDPRYKMLVDQKLIVTYKDASYCAVLCNEEFTQGTIPKMLFEVRNTFDDANVGDTILLSNGNVVTVLAIAATTFETLGKLSFMRHNGEFIYSGFARCIRILTRAKLEPQTKFAPGCYIKRANGQCFVITKDFQCMSLVKSPCTSNLKKGDMPVSASEVVFNLGLNIIGRIVKDGPHYINVINTSDLILANLYIDNLPEPPKNLIKDLLFQQDLENGKIDIDDILPSGAYDELDLVYDIKTYRDAHTAITTGYFQGKITKDDADNIKLILSRYNIDLSKFEGIKESE